MATAVPLVDVGLWYAGSAAGRRFVAAQVDDAMRSSGSVLVAGHRVPAALRRELRRSARDLFALPDAVKQAFAARVPGEPGWSCSEPAESFTVGPNHWPAAVPALRELVLAYLDAMRRLTDDVLEMGDGAHHRPEARTGALTILDRRVGSGGLRFRRASLEWLDAPPSGTPGAELLSLACSFAIDDRSLEPPSALDTITVG